MGITISAIKEGAKLTGHVAFMGRGKNGIKFGSETLTEGAT